MRATRRDAQEERKREDGAESEREREREREREGERGEGGGMHMKMKADTKGCRRYRGCRQLLVPGRDMAPCPCLFLPTSDASRCLFLPTSDASRCLFLPTSDASRCLFLPTRHAVGLFVPCGPALETHAAPAAPICLSEAPSLSPWLWLLGPARPRALVVSTHGGLPASAMRAPRRAAHAPPVTH
jgi:hypothetical protein